MWGEDRFVGVADWIPKTMLPPKVGVIWDCPTDPFKTGFKINRATFPNKNK